MLAMESCENICIGFVLVPVPLEMFSMSDGFSDVIVKPRDLGATWTFLTFGRCMVVQCCLKCCVIVVYLVSER